MREVTDALEDLEPATGDRLVSDGCVLHRDDVVAVALHDQRRQVRREVQPVERADDLAARFDAARHVRELPASPCNSSTVSPVPPRR